MNYEQLNDFKKMLKREANEDMLDLIMNEDSLLMDIDWMRIGFRESGQIRENLVGMDATESSGTADILSEERLLSGTASRDQSESGGRIPGTVHQIHDRAENRNVLGAERESQPESRGTGIAADRIPDSTGTGHHQSLQDTGGLSETAGTAALLNEEIKEAETEATSVSALH